ncbi:MAG: hypothetical protein GTN73_09075 [Candidatus Aminicenantes bacterium]|nr:hypothetical protein [Candidatus Aminicenantes bacterium]
MRKKAFLKSVSLFACFSIFMLSVPGVIAAEKTPKKFSFNRLLEKSTDTLSLLLPFLYLKVNDEKGNISSDQTSDDDSVQKIKATGAVVSMKGPKKGDS